jgi:hypothetical protein
VTRISAASSVVSRWLRQPSPAHWVAIAIAVFGAVSTFLAYRDYVMEDAYITYRYAQNLAAGQGFVFNPGERVLGTSTPLYAIVLAVARRLGLDIPLASGLLSAASLAATALLGAGLLRRWGHPVLSILFATLTVWGACDLDFFFGMEIPFYLMLLFAAFRCALEGRRTATGVLVGLAFLTRYDAAIFAISLYAVWWWRERRVPWRAGLVSLAVVVPWLVFAQLYFGSIFPNTLGAKTREVDVVDYMYQGAARQIWEFYSPLFHFWPNYLVPKIVVSLLTLILVGPIFAAARRLIARERLMAQLVVFPVLLWLGYSWIAPPIDHFWYLMPATYFVLLLALASWGEVTRRRRLEVARPVRQARLLRAVRIAPIAALALVTLLFLPQKLNAHAKLWMVSSFYRGRTDVYRTLARWIKDVGLDDVAVLMHEPGYFAYWSGNPMIDAAGLITKGIYFHGPAERRTKPDEIVRVHRPGLIVTPPLYWIGLPVEEYLTIYNPVPARSLLIQRSLFAERFPMLARHWLSREPYHPDRPELLRHPQQWDFGRGVDSGWVTGGSIIDFVGQPRPVRYDDQDVAEDYAHTVGPRDLWATLSSPPLLIDFDEIGFRFGGTDRRYTRARFIVDGQIVLQQTGGGKRPIELHDVYWPVWSWKGKVGVLQFDDADIEDGFLAADEVATTRYESFEMIDDFESTPGVAAAGADGVAGDDTGEGAVDGWGAFWETGFGAGPADLEPVALEHGLAMMVGRRAALSRGVADAAATGPVEMRSRPFVVDRNALSFMIFDFGGPGTRVELRVGGEVRRTWSGQQANRLQGVVWGVRGLIGEEAVLAVVDEIPGDGEWIGIDDVAIFDRPEEGDS